MVKAPLYLDPAEFEDGWDNVPTNDLNNGRQVPELPRVLSVDEVAELLRINRKTAYEAIAKGLIPGAQRLGRTIRVDRDALLAWMRGGPGTRAVLDWKQQGHVVRHGGKNGGTAG